MNLIFCSIEPVSAYSISLIDCHELMLLPFLWLKQYICNARQYSVVQDMPAPVIIMQKSDHVLYPGKMNRLASL